MAITYVGRGAIAGSGTSTANITVTLPASLLAGDTVLVLLTLNTRLTITPPDGTYVAVGTNSGANDPVLYIFQHQVANSSESSTNVVFTFTATFRAAVALAYRGCDPAAAVNQQSLAQSSTGVTTYGNPAVTPSVSGGQYVTTGALDVGAAFTSITGTPTLTTEFNAAAASGGRAFLVADVAAPASGTPVAANTYTYTSPTSFVISAASLILAPLAAPGGAQPEIFRRAFSNIQKIAYIRNLLAKPPIP